MPPVVTGYLLLIGFGRRGIFGQALADIGIRSVVPLDGRGVGLRDHGLSAYGAGDPPVV